MTVTPSSVLALDVGGKRIGVAVASLIARIPQPLTTLDATDPGLFPAIQKLVASESAGVLVVGFPRGLEGQHTAQTAAIETFTDQLRERIPLEVYFQDEALTSHHAKVELESRSRPYNKADVDALAAAYILEDWLGEHPDAGKATS